MVGDSNDDANMEAELPDTLKFSKKPRELPRIFSSKYFMPDESSEDAEAYAMEQISHVLSEKLTNRVKHIFSGYIDGDIIRCRKRKAKGETLARMGKASPSGHSFTIEEALFQREYGVLEIFEDDKFSIPIPLESLYNMLLPKISVESYIVYGYLVRLGYILKRKNPNNCRIFSVSRPTEKNSKSFHVLVLESSQHFPDLSDILEVLTEVEENFIKVARVSDGKPQFHTLALVDFPSLDS